MSLESGRPYDFNFGERGNHTAYLIPIEKKRKRRHKGWVFF
jgi:hypothetical protein